MNQDHAARREALGVLAMATPESLVSLWDAWAEKPALSIIRAPETGLVMLRGRAGGDGGAFNFGEATVSRATVRIGSGEVGHGYCLGRSTEKARLIAVFDALFQHDAHRIEAEILRPLRQAQKDADQRRRDETAATKVDFFTMVRGED